jgi:hypothetical protein
VGPAKLGQIAARFGDPRSGVLLARWGATTSSPPTHDQCVYTVLNSITVTPTQPGPVSLKALLICPRQPRRKEAHIKQACCVEPGVKVPARLDGAEEVAELLGKGRPCVRETQ